MVISIITVYSLLAGAVYVCKGRPFNLVQVHITGRIDYFAIIWINKLAHEIRLIYSILTTGL